MDRENFFFVNFESYRPYHKLAGGFGVGKDTEICGETATSCEISSGNHRNLKEPFLALPVNL